MEVASRFIGGMFIAISGISLYIAYFKGKRFLYYVKRFLKLISIAFGITLVTKFFLISGTIIFGIIHFLAISSILIYPFIKFRKEISIASSIFIILIYFLLIKSLDTNSPYLIPLGIYYGFTFDYYPLIPWFSIMLIARFFAEILYPRGKRRYHFNLKSKLFTFVALLGRNSLKIYLLHQPIILLILYLLGFRDFVKFIEI